MASWNVDTERTIRGLFMNRFAPKKYRGVMGVTMVIGELVGGWGTMTIWAMEFHIDVFWCMIDGFK